MHLLLPSQDSIASYVQLNSISENLPDFNSSPVTCSVVNNLTNTSKRYVKCVHIGQLLASTDYHIGVRIYLGYDAQQGNLPNNFSELSIFTVQRRGISEAPTTDPIQLNLQQQTVTTNVVRTVNNNNWSYSYYNQTVISTQDYDATTKAACNSCPPPPPLLS